MCRPQIITRKVGRARMFEVEMQMQAMGNRSDSMESFRTNSACREFLLYTDEQHSHLKSQAHMWYAAVEPIAWGYLVGLTY